MKKDIKTVDDYIANFPKEIQEKLSTIRVIIIENAPDAIEGISYGMPAYKTQKKPLVYFAGYSNHIGFYGTPNAHKVFAKELKGYKQGKGSVQFPLDKPLPTELIQQMVQFKAKENSSLNTIG